MREIPVALQLYTLRAELAEDFTGTLEKVAALGYRGVEFAGFGGLAPEEVKALVDRLGLEPVSAHVPLQQLREDVNKVIRELKTVGIRYCVCPFLMPDERSEAHYRSLIPFLNETGKRLKEEGITLCYHNHDFELERLQDGRMALEAIYEETSSDVLQTELDVYWLKKAGEDPVAWLKRYAGRSPLVHLKDMTADEEQFFAELGTGSVDLQAILDHGEEAGVQWWIVEQDASRRTPVESVEISLDYLREKLSYLAGK